MCCSMEGVHLWQYPSITNADVHLALQHYEDPMAGEEGDPMEGEEDAPKALAVEAGTALVVSVMTASGGGLRKTQAMMY